MATLREIAQQAGHGAILAIEERTAPRPNTKPRVLILVGSGMPHMGSEWGTEQRVVTTFYTGNREADQQVFGPKETPSSWQGTWRRTLLGRTPAIFIDESGVQQAIMDPLELHATLEDIARLGSRLKVTFMATATRFEGRSQTKNFIQHQIVRTGVMKSLSVQVTSDTDVAWSASFEWSGRGEAKRALVGNRSDQTLDGAADALSASNEAIKKVIDANLKRIAKAKIPKAASRLSLGQLEQIASTPQSLAQDLSRKVQANVTQLKRVANIARTLTTAPNDVVTTLSDGARNTIGVAKQYTDDFGQIPAEVQVLKVKAGALLRGFSYLTNIHEEARLTAAQAQSVDDNVRRVVTAGANRGAISVRESSTTRAGDIFAVHICKQGDTPQSLSVRFYRVSDQGGAILRSNRLPLHTPSFSAGKVLIIPTLTAAQSQQLRA
jgi:hypothetical protein